MQKLVDREASGGCRNLNPEDVGAERRVRLDLRQVELQIKPPAIGADEPDRLRQTARVKRAVLGAPFDRAMMFGGDRTPATVLAMQIQVSGAVWNHSPIGSQLTAMRRIRARR